MHGPESNGITNASDRLNANHPRSQVTVNVGSYTTNLWFRGDGGPSNAGMG
jgi:hypothetical protein